MAGTIPLSMTQQFDEYGQPLAGGQLYIIQAGTVSTPQDAFSDVNLTIKMPYPMLLDSAGRVPQFFLADGYIKVRLQDISGVVQLAADMILVIGPSSGGGGGGSSVDPTQLIQTGNMMFRYGVGAFAGYVRLNGLTLGNVTSGATERANADAQNLFQYLWGVDATLRPSGSLGTAALDWSNSKQLLLPDWRGYALGALDDMGNSAAGRLTATYWGGNPILLGSGGGAESRILLPSQVQIPQHQHAMYITDPGHSHSTNARDQGNAVAAGSWSTGSLTSTTAIITSNASNLGIGSSPGVPDNLTTFSGVGAGAQPHAAIGPRKLATFYIKL